jgi:hypothetical protein
VPSTVRMRVSEMVMSLPLTSPATHSTGATSSGRSCARSCVKTFVKAPGERQREEGGDTPTSGEPVSALRRVDLPAPLGPRRTVTEPASMERDTDGRRGADCPAYERSAPSSVSSTSPPGGGGGNLTRGPDLLPPASPPSPPSPSTLAPGSRSSPGSVSSPASRILPIALSLDCAALALFADAPNLSTQLCRRSASAWLRRYLGGGVGGGGGGGGESS